MLASSGERMPPCGVPVLVSLVDAVLAEDAGLEERLHQRQDALVPDPIVAPGPCRAVWSISSKHAVMSRFQHPLST